MAINLGAGLVQMTPVWDRLNSEVVRRHMSGIKAEVPLEVDDRKLSSSIVRSAESSADKAGKSASKRFSAAMATGVKALGAGLLGIGAGAGVATKKLYDLGSTFDDVTDTIRVGTGATGKNLESLVASAKRVGAEVPSSFEDIGTTVADVNTRLGLTGPTLEKVSSQFLQLANITGEQIDIQSVTKALGGFGIQGQNVSGALDKLYQVSQASGVSIADLSKTLGTSGAVVKNLGLNFGEAAVLVGTLDKAGLNSTAMMAAMSRSMVTLAKKGEDPKKAFSRVTREMSTLVKQGKDTEALNIAGKVFGTKGAPQFIAALKSGKVNLQDLNKMAGETDDTILGAGKDTADFAEQWQLFKNKMSVVVAPAAEGVFQAIGDGMTKVNEVAVPAIQNFIAEWQKGVGTGGRFRDIVRQVVDFLDRQKEAFMGLVSEWQAGEGTGGRLRGIVADLGQKILAGTAFALRHRTAFMMLGATLAGLYGTYKLLRVALVAYRGIMSAVSTATAAYNGVKRVMLALGNSSIVTFARETAAKAANRTATLAATAGEKAYRVAKIATSAATWSAIGSTIKNTAALVAHRAVTLTVSAAQKAMAAAQWLVNVALSANPIGLVILALVALGAALVVAWKKSDTFRAIVTKAWNGIKSAADVVWKFLRDKVLKPMGTFFDTTLPEKFRAFGRAFGQVWSGIKAAAAKPVNFVIKTVWNKGLRPALNLIPGVNLGEATPIPGYKDGGLIPGRFSAMNRDNVLALSKTGIPTARVEPGEFVVNRTQTARHRAVLEAINAGNLQRFAGGGYVWPTNTRALSGNYSGHSGVDIAVGTGNPMFAVDSGVIDYTGWGRGYGNAVFLRDSKGVPWVYGHGSRATVSAGQQVGRGQIIGYTGNTGRSSGPHLHIEAALGGAFARTANRSYTLGLLNGSAMPQGGGDGGGGSSFFHLLTKLPNAIKNIRTQINNNLTTPWGKLIKSAVLDSVNKAQDWGMGKIRSLTDVVSSTAGKVANWGKGIWNKIKGGNIQKWRPTVARALAYSGVGGGRNDEDLWLRQIQTESNGNPNLVQDPRVYDINIRRGDPARGLVQVPGVTWADFGYGMGPFFNNWKDPFKNLVVGMRAANAQHRPDWRNAIGKGRGYSTGATSTLPGWAMIDERGNEWVNFSKGDSVLPHGVTPVQGPQKIRGEMRITNWDEGLVELRGELVADMEWRGGRNE